MNRTASAPSMIRFVQLFLAMLMATLLSACGGGGGKVGLPTGTALFTNAPPAVTLAGGASSTYTVGGGNPTYSASSSNRDVATVTVSGTSVVITGVGGGTATITVSDAVGASVNVPVTVTVVTPPVPPPPTPLFTTAPTAITLAPGATGSYAIRGGTPAYTVISSNTGVARVTLSGGDFVVTAVAAGSAQLVITDTTGASLSLAITVTPPSTNPPPAFFTTAPPAVTLTPGAAAQYAISGGQGPYAVASSAPGVASVVLNGSGFAVTGVANGSAQLVITDATGATLNIAVTVQGVTTEPTPLFTTAPSTLSVAQGATALYAISGGQGPYAVTSGNPGVVRVALTGSDFVITGVAPGTAPLLLTDARGTGVTLSVTVTGLPPADLFTTAPSAVSLAQGATALYGISGGQAPYAVTSSNPGVARVALSGSDFVVTGVVPGTASLLLTDARGTGITLTVTVGGVTPADLFTTAPRALTLAPGATALYAISGGYPAYSITSSAPGVARVALSGSDFVVTAVAAGSAELLLTDTRGTSISLAVTVAATAPPTLFTTAPTTVSVSIGGSASYRIGGGVPAYEVVSSDSTVARVAINGNDFLITGVAAGSAQIQITDSVGATRSVAVTVGSGGAAPALFTTAPAAVSVATGVSASFVIGGGRAPYAVTSSDTAIARATLAGSSYTITGIATGVAQIRVSDADGNALTVTTTVGVIDNAVDLFTSAPPAVSVAVGSSASYSIGGGKPAYAVSSSNVAVARVALVGNDITISGVSNGTAQIRVVDSLGASLLVTVTTGNGASTLPLFITAPAAVSVDVAGTAAYRVGGGRAPYAVSSSNASVARVTINGEDFVITGFANGVANITITDANGEAKVVAVTVGSGTGGTAFYSTAPSTITIGVSSQASFLVGGGSAPYSASSSNAGVAQASVVGGMLTITGVGAGQATIVVADALGARDEVTVTVPAGLGLYTSAPGAITLGYPSTTVFNVGGGTGIGYSATSSDNSVATVSVAGTALTINGVGPGSAQIIVSDSARNTVIITATVTQATPVSLAVSPASATGSVGDTLGFILSGGTAPYTVTVANPSIASVTTNGSSFSVLLRNVGNTTATVVDARGQIVIVPIIAEQATPILRLSPNALLVAENSVDTITLNIYGGTGPYRAFTSDQTLSAVTIVGNTLQIAVGSNTNRCINPIDDNGVYIRYGTFDVTVTAVDSLGASATSILTIKDNGFGLNSGCP